MSKTLAQLRESKPTSRPERTLPLCLAPHLVAEVQALTEELQDLPLQRFTADNGEEAGPPRRMVNPAPDPRATEIQDRLTELLAEMAEHEGSLRIRASDDGDWRRWVNAHPARRGPVKGTKDVPATAGEPGWERDFDVTRSICNADDLIDSLGTYAYAWDDERIGEGDWEILSANIGNADKKGIARQVVAMHETEMDLPKWRGTLSATLRSGSDSPSPALMDDPPLSS